MLGQNGTDVRWSVLEVRGEMGDGGLIGDWISVGTVVREQREQNFFTIWGFL